MKINQNYLPFVLCLISGIGILSCDGDDDKKTSSVMGSWKEVSIETKSCPNAAENRLDECAPNNNCETWKFNSDGTFSRTPTTGPVVNGTYILAGPQISLCYTGCLQYTYSIAGSTLTITEVTAGNECVTVYKVAKI